MQKVPLLEILSGMECPICHKAKPRFVWTCSACYKPHQWSMEQKRLSDSCDAHMVAAENFLARAARPIQKPESD